MKKRRFRQREEAASGEDSFLDIVANLVGILVILIMVIGVRAQGAADDVEPDPSAMTEIPSDEVASIAMARSEVDLLTSDIHEIEQRASELHQVAEGRQRERHQLQVLLTAARHELDASNSQLDDQRRADIQLTRDLQSLTDRLDQTQATQATLDGLRREPIQLAHLPTPLAQTVFGQEEHFRLKEGRLAYVPINELTDMLRAEAPRKADRLRRVPQITETLGPVRGFHLQYVMRRRSVATMTNAGPAVRQMAELERFVLIPMSSDLGEPVAEAMKPNSQFRQYVESLRSDSTVITVWTYPDSYSDFRRLQQYLRQRGFLTAARPLPEGHPIAGSPEGSRSAAQ